MFYLQTLRAAHLGQGLFDLEASFDLGSHQAVQLARNGIGRARKYQLHGKSLLGTAGQPQP